MITEVREITSTSAVVEWMYNGMSSFNVRVTGAGIDRTVSTSDKIFTLSGRFQSSIGYPYLFSSPVVDLVPSSDYVVRVSLSSDLTDFQTSSFTTLSCSSCKLVKYDSFQAIRQPLKCQCGCCGL